MLGIVSRLRSWWRSVWRCSPRSPRRRMIATALSSVHEEILRYQTSNLEMLAEFVMKKFVCSTFTLCLVWFTFTFAFSFISHDSIRTPSYAHATLGEEVHGEEVLGEGVLEEMQFHVKIVTTTNPICSTKKLQNTGGSARKFSNFDILNIFNYFCIKIISILKADT